MPIHIHEGQTIKGATMMLTEHIFRNCKLVNCVLVYEGGPWELVNCSLENCQWMFRGAAWDTIRLQMTLGIVKPGQAPPGTMPSVSGSQVN